jgi:hypothetical protein
MFWIDVIKSAMKKVTKKQCIKNDIQCKSNLIYILHSTNPVLIDKVYNDQYNTYTN